MSAIDRLAVTRFLPSPDSSLKRLAAAVILRAIQDAAREGFNGEDAGQFVLGDGAAFLFWCDLADAHPERVREAVRRGAGAGTGGPGRKRIYSSHAERQRAYKRRKGLGG